ncbi:MAG TPA: aminopeptidase [Bacilli bacterium]|nr:aminopeptidase [Bacilli bacterium]
MKEKLEKYAEVLLKGCLNIRKDSILFISFNIERIDFVRILSSIAYKIGVKEIYYDIVDPYLKHDAIKNLSLSELKNTNLFNKCIWNEYAKKGAYFLMLASENPGLMSDISSKKLSDITMYGYETRREFDELRDNNITPWCIALVPTESWAKQVLNNSLDPINEMWDIIFDICGINENDSLKAINDNINLLNKRANKLNELKLRTLIYKNNLGTNFSIDLPKNHIWNSGKETISNGDDILVNFPTFEIFTSPDCMSANGIVYSSKPLSYNNVVIDEFNITFKDGKAIECKAKQGEETLINLINSCPNSDRLGEVALVPFDSPISNSNIVFYETLFDENASCHIALGASFKDCILNGKNMTKKELEENNLNECDNHVDFMIGTKDLEIIGIKEDGKEIQIFKDGNFVI